MTCFLRGQFQVKFHGEDILLVNLYSNLDWQVSDNKLTTRAVSLRTNYSVRSLDAKYMASKMRHIVRFAPEDLA